MRKVAVSPQQMTKNYYRRATVLAVTRGKGGVGKTNISANLGICLALSGKRVLLIDADFSLGNLDVLLNINSRYNISHLLCGRKSIDQIIQTGPEGLEVIFGASGFEELADLTEFHRQRLLREFCELQFDNDVIIIDTAAGISKSVAGFCLAADHVLVVTTPEATSMTDAYAMIKVLAGNKYSGRISLIVNMAQAQAEGRTTYQQIATVAKRFLNVNVYNAGIFLSDEKVGLAVRQRKAVVFAYPRAAITSSLTALAAKLNKGTNIQTGKEGFFRKVADWFF